MLLTFFLKQCHAKPKTVQQLPGVGVLYISPRSTCVMLRFRNLDCYIVMIMEELDNKLMYFSCTPHLQNKSIRNKDN